MAPDSVSVVIPVYNSERTLPLLLGRLGPILEKRGRPFEIILVNDGSMDRSWDVIIEATKQRTNIRGINLSRNYGQHNALLCGIRIARHDVVVTMDDDLQHPPEEVPLLLSKLAEGHDAVYGVPAQEQQTWWRNAASTVVKMALRHLLGVQIARQVSAFRAFRAGLRAVFEDYRSPTVSIDVLLSWSAASFSSVVVECQPRNIGRSNYSFFRLFRHAMNLTTGFSAAPLRFASLVGFLAVVFGAGILVYVMCSFLAQGNHVPGFTFLASIIAIFSGINLFALGIMGEYVARIHYRLLDKPIYVIREETSSQEVQERRQCA